MSATEDKAIDNIGALLAKGDAAGAARLLRPIVEAHPEDVEKRVALAQLLLASGDGDAGKREVLEALRLSPEHEQAMMLLAGILAMGEEGDEALAQIDKLIARFGPSRDRTYMRAAILLSHSVNRPEDALSILLEVTNEEDCDDSLLHLLMQAQLRLADRPSALATARRMLGQGTSSVNALILLVEEDLHHGRASEVIERLSALAPELLEHPLVAAAMAAAHRLAHHPEEYEEWQEKAAAGIPAFFADRDTLVEWIRCLIGENHGN